MSKSSNNPKKFLTRLSWQICLVILLVGAACQPAEPSSGHPAKATPPSPLPPTLAATPETTLYLTPSPPPPQETMTLAPPRCQNSLENCPELIYFREMLENPSYNTLLAMNPPPELADLHYELADRKADLEEIDQQIAAASLSGNTNASLGFVQARSQAENAYRQVRERALDAWESFLASYNVTLPRRFEDIYSLTGIAFANPQEGWIVGRKGTILHYDGTKWERWDSQIKTDLAGLALDPDGQGWAWGIYGDTGASTLLRLEGKQWHEVENPASLPVIRSIFVLSPSLAWMLASNVNGTQAEILRHNGKAWFQEKKIVFKGATNIQMRSHLAGWVDGYAHNQVLVYLNGSWRTYMLTSPQGCGINQVQLLAPDTGWAVGEDGCIFKFDGNHWAIEKTPGLVDLRQLWMISIQDGWAMGQNGTILHYDGKNWLSVTSPTTETIEFLAGYRSNLALAMTSSGQTLRYNGIQWGVENFPVNLGFSSSPIFLENGEIWAITPLHGIAHFANGGWEIYHEWPEELP
ncbi:MAG: hypothetical protein HPY59_04950 [Anaerolineae bacterium]|nr:hypothetical protein [Anaerolineae bacterium]